MQPVSFSPQELARCVRDAELRQDPAEIVALERAAIAAAAAATRQRLIAAGLIVPGAVWRRRRAEDA